MAKFRNTVLVNVQIDTNESRKFHWFLNERLHNLSLDDIEGKNPLQLMEMDSKKKRCYEEVVKTHLMENISSVKSFVIISVVGFDNEESLDKFIKDDQVSVLNDMFR